MSIPIEIDLWLQEHAKQAEPVLILAARQGRIDVLNHILNQGADLNVLDLYGNNALWAACFAESAQCIKRLLEAGIAIDFQNSTGASALIYASSSGKHTVVNQLLQAGANPLLSTQDDFSALDLAANRECLRLMKQAIVDHRNTKAD
jgi:thiosulfate/3-mercaptopyruvate sulfurtransferase